MSEDVDFSVSRPEGFGCYKKWNGDIYEGEIRDGRPNGKGTLKGM